MGSGYEHRFGRIRTASMSPPRKIPFPNSMRDPMEIESDDENDDQQIAGLQDHFQVPTCATGDENTM